MATMSLSQLKQVCQTPLLRRMLEFKVYKRKIQGYNVTRTTLRHRWIKRLPVFSSGVQAISTQSDKVTSACPSCVAVLVQTRLGTVQLKPLPGTGSAMIIDMHTLCLTAQCFCPISSTILSNTRINIGFDTVSFTFCLSKRSLSVTTEIIKTTADYVSIAYALGIRCTS